MHPGIWGGIIGSAIGMIGGVLGTYSSIKSAKSPQERSFVIKAAILMWFGVTAFIAVMFTLNTPYKWLLWVLYVILLPLAIVWMNKRQSQIRQAESKF